jgi:16S rRNA A1518/A1519 N6-dimethyltransferase RsmA/KsgA/DIM1 with predicted DNA glycosylase/AP lyase activity
LTTPRSSNQKGDALEQLIFDLFQAEINDGRFWAKQENCKIFRKKGYYSKDREKEIIFDVSIEIFLPNATEYSSLVLIECKNYGHRVPVDDTEEFFAKVQQVAAANSKAIIASTASYQSSALAYAKSKGIGLQQLKNQNL